jgi:hypothetical protein
MSKLNFLQKLTSTDLIVPEHLHEHQVWQKIVNAD